MRRFGNRGVNARQVLALGVALAAGVGLRGLRADVAETGDTTLVFQKTTDNWQVQDPSAVTLYVGLNATGTLNISGIASVTTPVPLGENFPSLSIGSAATANGGWGVTGANANLIGLGLAEVGEFGTGTLQVTQGGHVGTVDFAAGGQTTGTGFVGVDGKGSTITVTDNFLIGNQGNGTLDVDNGGKVMTAFGVIGGSGMGEATFSNNSLFSCTESLIVARGEFWEFDDSDGEGLGGADVCVGGGAGGG